MAERTGRLTFSREERVMGVLLILVPATLLASHLSWPFAVQFFLSVGAVIPLAAYIGAATESLADSVGGKVGGLLNATFGNAPDLLFGVFGVQRGLIPFVKATIVGALISNSALIMGLCYIVAGLRFTHPRFDAHEAGHHSVLMMLTVGAILFPSIGSFALCPANKCSSPQLTDTLQHVSVGIALVLLLSYLAYLAYGVFGWESLSQPKEEGDEVEVLRERVLAEQKTPWPTWFSLAALALSTIILIPVVDILTGAVTPVTQSFGWTEVFVGMVIVANSGNVAEGYAALKFAFDRGGIDPVDADSGLDLGLGIASASSIQIATFVAPLVVLYSLFSHPMTLVFSPVEIAILALLVALFAYIGHDGESNWLEGVQLLALYAMAAVVFFALPVSAFGG